MSRLEDQLNEYRELRDASRKVLMADIEHARATFSKEDLASRYLGRVGDGAKDVFEVAKVNAVDHRGIIAILLGAIALWLGREPILNALALDEDAQPTDEDPDAAPDERTDSVVEEAAGDTPVVAAPEVSSPGDDNEH